MAKLARIRLQDNEEKEIEESLKRVFEWVSQLDDLCLQHIDTPPPPPSCLRKDEVTDDGYPEKILENAPMKEDNYFVVPGVLL